MAYKRIGEVAKEIGVSRQTIRNYEAQGLIPKAERMVSGSRMYRESDVAKIKRALIRPSK